MAVADHVVSLDGWEDRYSWSVRACVCYVVLTVGVGIAFLESGEWLPGGRAAGIIEGVDGDVDVCGCVLVLGSGDQGRRKDHLRITLTGLQQQQQ